MIDEEPAFTDKINLVGDIAECGSKVFGSSECLDGGIWPYKKRERGN